MPKSTAPIDSKLADFVPQLPLMLCLGAATIQEVAVLSVINLTYRQEAEMPTDPFNPMGAKLQEAHHNLRRLETVFIRPEHAGQRDAYRVAQLSCPRMILHYEWHDQFKAALHGFLAAARSVPDIIQSTFGYDAKQKAWLDTLDQDEQDRRTEFRQRFSPFFTAFNQLPLSEQRRKVIHKDGMADWHVEVKGHRGTYYGDNTTALPQVEDDPPISGDPALDVAVFSSPHIHVQPLPKDFWLGPKGDPNRTPLFDQCRNYLNEAEKLVNDARSLFAQIHDGQPFTVPQEPFAKGKGYRATFYS